MKVTKIGLVAVAVLCLTSCGQQTTPATPQAAAQAQQTPAPVQPQPVQQPPVVLQQAAPIVVQQAPIVVQQAPQGGTAYVFNPPSNVRASATGPILCSINQPTTINIYGFGGVTYAGARKITWYQTDACGPMGVIANSQIRQ